MHHATASLNTGKGEVLTHMTDTEVTRGNLLETREFTFVVSQEQHEEFTRLTGDYNPIHKRGMVHGAHTIARISAVMGPIFPGKGTAVQEMRAITFEQAVRVNSMIYVHITPVGRLDRRRAEFEIRAQNDQDKRVFSMRVIVRLPARLRDVWPQ